MLFFVGAGMGNPVPVSCGKCRWEYYLEQLAKTDDDMTRGIRNNNPGNLVKGSKAYIGEVVPSTDSRFRQFKDMEHGYRAMFVTLANYKLVHGCDTVSKVINRWAPPVENDTTRYIKFVAEKTGIKPNTVFDVYDKPTILGLVKAISWQENGVKPDDDQIERGWRLWRGVPF